MNYDCLERSYWDAQIQRVERLRQRIATRAELSAGRVIPDDEDLVIGSGRRLQATVVFVDISNFSSRPSADARGTRTSAADLEFLFHRNDPYHRGLRRRRRKKHRRWTNGLFEDRSVLDPGANSVKRALACALTMDATNEWLIAPVLRATGVPTLQFRTTWTMALSRSRESDRPGTSMRTSRLAIPRILRPECLTWLVPGKSPSDQARAHAFQTNGERHGVSWPP